MFGGARLSQIAIGSGFRCGLLLDGRASCRQSDPRYGDPDLKAVVSGVPGELQFATIAAVGKRVCGLTLEGTSHCWGAEQDPLGEDRLPLPSDEHISIVASQYGRNVCAITRQGGIECSDWLQSELEEMTNPLRGVTSIGDHFNPSAVLSDGYRAVALGDGEWRSDHRGVRRFLFHACALRESRIAVCWGANDFGQASPPRGVQFNSISAGTRHTCGVTVQGPVRCWGANDAGQSTPPSDETFSDLFAVEDSTCGLRADGAVVCWGVQGFSAPPQLVPFDINLPEQHSTDIKQLDRFGIFDGTECSTQRFCTDAPLTRATLAVWLDRLMAHTASDAGTNVASATSLGVQDDLWWAPHAQRLADLGVMRPCDAAGRDWCGADEVTRGEFEQILAAALETSVRTHAGAVPTAATLNTSAWSGRTCSAPASTVRPKPAMSKPSAGGRRRRCSTGGVSMLRDSRRLSSRQSQQTTAVDAADAQMGPSSAGEEIRLAPHTSRPMTESSMSVTTASTVWHDRQQAMDVRGWDGYNHGRIRDVFTSIGGHESDFCAQQPDGSRHCWTPGSFRRSLDLDAGFIDVSANEYFTCGRRTDRSVQCWSDPSGAHPAQSFTSITTANGFACGRIVDDKQHCWRLKVDAEIPDDVVTGDFVQFSDSGYHTCAVKSDGTVACWGRDDRGEASPPPGGTPYAQVSAGGVWEIGHTCGLRTEGTVDCWGDNSRGQSDPPDGDDFARVAASGVHACGLHSDGRIECWGQSVWSGEDPPTARRYVDVVVGAGGSYGYEYYDDTGRRVHAAPPVDCGSTASSSAGAARTRRTSPTTATPPVIAAGSHP